MNVILYMAITANGMIAKENDETPFTSKADYVSFKKMCLRTKAVIAGRRTYDLIRNDTAFFWPQCHYYIITSNKNFQIASVEPNVTMVSFKPKQILQRVKRDGYKEVCIMGGGQTNASFLAAGAVDEIILDVEPYVYLRGIPLFRPIRNVEISLQLVKIKKLSSQTIQLHYAITK